jgi:hypothetical protein
MIHGTLPSRTDTQILGDSSAGRPNIFELAQAAPARQRAGQVEGSGDCQPSASRRLRGPADPATQQFVRSCDCVMTQLEDREHLPSPSSALMQLARLPSCPRGNGLQTVCLAAVVTKRDETLERRARRRLDLYSAQQSSADVSRAADQVIWDGICRQAGGITAGHQRRSRLVRRREGARRAGR